MSRVRILFTRTFWLDAAERAVKTFGQGALGAVGQDILGADLFQADLTNVLASGAGLAILSLLTSIASANTDGISPASIAPPAG